MARISVVVPTFNAGGAFGRLLESLQTQKPVAADELIVVDSGSRDQTLGLAEHAGAKIVRYTERFDHGLARDAGVAAASGEIVVLTVQDAVPQGADWLLRLSRHFDDPAVAGVSGRQVPPPDGPLELQIKSRLETQSGLTPVHVALADHPQYATYSAAEKLELYRFDNVSSALRRSVWEKIPFGPCTYAEDLQWARKVLEAGHAIVRDPSAAVEHAHRRAFGYEFRRGLLDAWMLDELFGYRYSFLRRLNRVRALLGPQPSRTQGSRMEALKTYSAHALARSTYGFYRWVCKPLGVGRETLRQLSGGI